MGQIFPKKIDLMIRGALLVAGLGAAATAGGLLDEADREEGVPAAEFFERLRRFG